MKRSIFPSLALALAMLACNITAKTPAPVVTTPPVTEPPVSATLMPVGFFVTLPDQPNLFEFNDLNGATVGDINTPSVQAAYSGSVVLAGGVSGSTLPPVIYFDYTSKNLIENIAGTETVLLNNPQFYNMTSAAGQPVLAYGTADMTPSGLNTTLFIGIPDSLATADPQLTLTDDPLGAISPLSLIMKEGMLADVWFTKMAYGIGGDIIFPPTRGLFHLDMTTGILNEIALPETIYSPSLSPSASWLAYSSHDNATGLGTLKLKHLVTGEMHAFPLLPDSDRGAGSAVFSPDDLHVAWMEGLGSNMGDTAGFRGTVRLAGTDGTILNSYPASDFDDVAGFTVSWADPVGWLDNDTLAVQVSDASVTKSSVLRLTLSTGVIDFLSDGNFVDLTYP